MRLNQESNQEPSETADKELVEDLIGPRDQVKLQAKDLYELQTEDLLEICSNWGSSETVGKELVGTKGSDEVKPRDKSRVK